MKARQTSVGSDPVFAGPCLDEIIHVWMRQPFVSAEAPKLVAIKPRYPISRAEPEKAARITDDLVDGIVRQAISHGVSSNGQTLSLGGVGNDEKQQDKKDFVVEPLREHDGSGP